MRVPSGPSASITPRARMPVKALFGPDPDGQELEMPTTARVPEPFIPLFDAAESYVRAHFDRLDRNPERGTIHVDGQRYVLVRAASLTTGFIEVMRDVIGEEEALKFWYRMARVIGRDDARAFCEARNLTD